jgi:hypothetical protein
MTELTNNWEDAFDEEASQFMDPQAYDALFEVPVLARREVKSDEEFERLKTEWEGKGLSVGKRTLDRIDGSQSVFLVVEIANE